jgi:RNA polymerase sigma-70 factor (ECF subfamily)
MNRSDEELVEAVRQGDREAFGPLVERYQRRMVAAAYHLVGNFHEAQDLAQESFVEAYCSLSRLREPGRFKSWLHGILYHKCLKYLRRRKPAVISWESGELEERLIVPSPEEQWTWDLVPLLNQLPPPYREVLAAKYLEDLGYDEIAARLGTTVNNVRVRCCRAKQALRELIARAEAASGSSGQVGGGRPR